MNNLLKVALGSAGLVLASVQTAGADIEFEVRMVEMTYQPAAEFPYHFEYEMEITQWDPMVAHVNDFHFQWPVADPGALLIEAPEGWLLDEYFDGDSLQIGFFTDDQDVWMNEAGTLGGWHIEGQNPQLDENGEAYLTEDGQPVSLVIPASFPVGGPPIPAVSGWGLGAMALLVLAAGTFILLKRRRLAKA